MLSQELPFASVARLLGWQTLDDVLSATTIRSLVRAHGQIIRRAEQVEISALAMQDDLSTLDLNLLPHEQPRRRARWPAERNAAVGAALADELVRPPDGVSWATGSACWPSSVRRRSVRSRHSATSDQNWNRSRCS